MNRPITIVALTEAGLALGERLLRHIPEAELLYKPTPFSAGVQQRFRAGNALVMITATGIAVRSLAPVLQNKHDDPPVLVLDERGDWVIPLLSGHEGGANEWARQVADLLHGQLVMTTANTYLRPVYTIGMGCERDCPVEELQRLLDDCLRKAGLSLDDIASINSIALKADEVGLIQLGEHVNKPYDCWDVHQLRSVEHLLNSRSDYIFNTVGVYGVAEAAALYAAKTISQSEPELALIKHKTRKATCAIARSYPASEPRS